MSTEETSKNVETIEELINLHGEIESKTREDLERYCQQKMKGYQF